MKSSFKKASGGLFKSENGTNQIGHSTKSALTFNSAQTWEGAGGSKGHKRSSQVAFGTWVKKKEEVKEEFNNENLGVLHFHSI